MRTEQTSKTMDFSKMSEDELESYVSAAKIEMRELKAQIRAFRKQAAESRQKILETEAEIKVWKELNQIELKKLGWEDLTEDEFTWLRENLYKEWPYFKPSNARAIKERYAERMQKLVDSSLDKKFAPDPKMEVPSGWIDRAGKYFGVGPAEHDKFAWEYLNKTYGQRETEIKVASSGGAAHSVLEKAGWIRVMKWPGLDVQFVLPRLLSHTQKGTLRTYCDIYNVKYPLEEDLF